MIGRGLQRGLSKNQGLLLHRFPAPLTVSLQPHIITSAPGDLTSSLASVGTELTCTHTYPPPYTYMKLKSYWGAKAGLLTGLASIHVLWASLQPGSPSTVSDTVFNMFDMLTVNSKNEKPHKKDRNWISFGSLLIPFTCLFTVVTIIPRDLCVSIDTI